MARRYGARAMRRRPPTSGLAQSAQRSRRRKGRQQLPSIMPFVKKVQAKALTAFRRVRYGVPEAKPKEVDEAFYRDALRGSRVVTLGEWWKPVKWLLKRVERLKARSRMSSRPLIILYTFGGSEECMRVATSFAEMSTMEEFGHCDFIRIPLDALSAAQIKSEFEITRVPTFELYSFAYPSATRFTPDERSIIRSLVRPTDEKFAADKRRLLGMLNTVMNQKRLLATLEALKAPRPEVPRPDADRRPRPEEVQKLIDQAKACRESREGDGEVRREAETARNMGIDMDRASRMKTIQSYGLDGIGTERVSEQRLLRSVDGMCSRDFRSVDGLNLSGSINGGHVGLRARLLELKYDAARTALVSRLESKLDEKFGDAGGAEEDLAAEFGAQRVDAFKEKWAKDISAVRDRKRAQLLSTLREYAERKRELRLSLRRLTKPRASKKPRKKDREVAEGGSVDPDASAVSTDTSSVAIASEKGVEIESAPPPEPVAAERKEQKKVSSRLADRQRKLAKKSGKDKKAERKPSKLQLFVKRNVQKAQKPIGKATGKVWKRVGPFVGHDPPAPLSKMPEKYMRYKLRPFAAEPVSNPPKVEGTNMDRVFASMREHCNRDLWIPPYERTFRHAAMVMDATAEMARDNAERVQNGVDAVKRAWQNVSGVAGAVWRLPFVRVPLKACWVLKYVGMYMLFDALRAEQRMDEELETICARERAVAEAARLEKEEKELAERDRYNAVARERSRKNTESIFQMYLEDKMDDHDFDDYVRKLGKETVARGCADVVELLDMKEEEGWDDDQFVTAMAGMPSSSRALDLDALEDDAASPLENLLDGEIRKDIGNAQKEAYGKNEDADADFAEDDGKPKSPWSGSIVDFI